MSRTFQHPTPGTSDGSFLDEAFGEDPNCCIKTGRNSLATRIRLRSKRASVLEATRIQICQTLPLGLVLLLMTAAALRAHLAAPTA